MIRMAKKKPAASQPAESAGNEEAAKKSKNHITVNIRRTLYEKLKEIGAKEDRKPGWLINKAVDEFIKRKVSEEE